MEMEIRVPKDCVGDVMGDLSARRGKVLGMDSKDPPTRLSRRTCPRPEITPLCPIVP